MKIWECPQMENDIISAKDCEEKIILSMLAAFVDGEGSIVISRTQNASGNCTYRQLIELGNTDIRLIEWLVDNFGGKISGPSSYKRDNCKDVYQWYLYGYKSYKVIKNIYPYLILKQEQADCAIELYEKVSRRFRINKPLVDWRRNIAEELYHRCRELNKKGVSDNAESNNGEVEITVKLRKDVLDEWLL